MKITIFTDYKTRRTITINGETFNATADVQKWASNHLDDLYHSGIGNAEIDWGTFECPMNLLVYTCDVVTFERTADGLYNVIKNGTYMRTINAQSMRIARQRYESNRYAIQEK